VFLACGALVSFVSVQHRGRRLLPLQFMLLGKISCVVPPVGTLLACLKAAAGSCAGILALGPAYFAVMLLPPLLVEACSIVSSTKYNACMQARTCIPA
jgi:hypothetical protein